ncbi:DNA-processing protein DprA [Longispora albida]|uniref:DNA-processing protein DprA n=1 Tax=Longispora albida TaxID=203523 RepID=UPI00037D8EA0|nr:DNA-processing protein DprA [Longispora albida]
MNTPANTRLARVALACLIEPGNTLLGQLLATAGPEQALDMLLTAPPEARSSGAPAQLAALGAAARARLGGREPEEVATTAIEAAERLGARLITPEDADWPSSVDDLARTSSAERDSQPPICLWVRGRHPVAEALDRSIAIVGSRAASNYGTRLATELGYDLARREWAVVSGGAYGIDAAAHRGALTAGGLTAVVLACGIDTIYPLGHASLFDQVAEEGLLITEWPPGATPHRTRFLVRNRLIAALSRGTVLVEAAARSGARSTARRARQLGRPVMACPGPANSLMSAGTHSEIRDCNARLVTSAEQVLEEAGRIGEYLAMPPRGPGNERDGLEPAAARLLDSIPLTRSRSLEEVAASAGISPAEARRNLPSLIARQLVTEDPPGRLRTRRAPRRTRPPGKPA